jgi:hypothetical protein
MFNWFIDTKLISDRAFLQSAPHDSHPLIHKSTKRSPTNRRTPDHPPSSLSNAPGTRKVKITTTTNVPERVELALKQPWPDR